MAQQITSNTSLIDALTSTNNNGFVDASANQFDSVLNIANKSITQQNKTTEITTNTLNQSNDINSQKVLSINSSYSKDSASNVDNRNLNKEISYKDDVSANSNVKIDEAKIVTNTETTMNEPVVSQGLDSEISANNDKLTDDIANQELEFNDLDVETSVDDVEMKEEIKTDIVDIVSKYVLLENDISTEELVLEENVMLEEELLTDEVVDVDTTEVSQEETNEKQDNIIDEIDINQESIDIADVNDIKLHANVNLVASADANISNNVVEIKNEGVTLVNTLSENVKNIELNVEILQDKKELISQKIVDELNVIIEDITDDTSSESLLNDALMDTTEQVVKYSMEKNNEIAVSVESLTVDDEIELLEFAQNVQTEDMDAVVEEVDTPERSLEDLVEEADEIVKNSDDIDIDVDTETSKDDELDVQFTNESETSLTEDSDYQGESNFFDKREDVKKDVKVSKNETSEFVDVDIDIEGINSESKLSFLGDVVAVAGKSHVAGVGQSVGIQASASQNISTMNITKEDVIAQIHSKLQSMNSTTNTKLTMVLNPESLGKVSIQLTNTKSGMVAEMIVASQAVKDILDSSLSSLKDTLVAQGVQVNDVSVKVSQSENSTEMDYTEQENAEGNRQEQSRQQQEQGKNKNKFEELFFNNLNEEEQKN